MKAVFLSAHWSNLILANYEVPRTILEPLVPCGTELDLWQGKCLVSLVGFMFLNTRVKGITVPFHKNFEEINLRFYVKRNVKGEWRRGTVFIKEIVPKPLIAVVAKTIYNEPYVFMKMNHSLKEEKEMIQHSYSCFNGRWNTMEIKALSGSNPFLPQSEEEFIVEHYWGYTQINKQRTQEYGVEHPPWRMHAVTDYFCDFDFGKLYGNGFGFLSEVQPQSVFFAKGSDVMVRDGRKL